MDYSALGLTVFPDFISIEEELEVLSLIDKKPKTKYKNRNSIQRFGSSIPYDNNIISSIVPEFLDKISEKIVAAGLLEIKPDSITINEYFDGQSIEPHIDNNGSGKIITILGLVGSAEMVFQLKEEKFALDFPPRCLIQLRDEIRYKWKHSISPVTETRYSLVFRNSDIQFKRNNIHRKL